MIKTQLKLMNDEEHDITREADTDTTRRKKGTRVGTTFKRNILTFFTHVSVGFRQLLL